MKLSLISWLNLQYRLMIIYSGCSQPPWILCTKLIARTTTNTSLQAGGQATIIFKLKRHTYLHHHHHVYIYIYIYIYWHEKSPWQLFCHHSKFLSFSLIGLLLQGKNKTKKRLPIKISVPATAPLVQRKNNAMPLRRVLCPKSINTTKAEIPLPGQHPMP